MELWNEKAIEKSERILNELKKISDFVLVGGWAVFLWRKAIKSIDIDIYTPDQCGLIIPCKDVFKNKWFETIERFKVLKAEPLMLLKLDVESKRSSTIKGFKDRCDIFALITKLDLDTNFLNYLFKKYNAFTLRKRLIKIVKDSSEEYKCALQKTIIPSKLKETKERNYFKDKSSMKIL